MRILMIHPHDLRSDLEPWTVRISYLARELRLIGHEVAIVYHALGEPGPVEPLAGTDIQTIPLVRYSRTLMRKSRVIRDLAAWADLVHFQKCFAYASLPALKAAYRLGLPVHYDWDDWEYEIYNYRPLDRFVGRSLDRLERCLPRLVDTVSVASEGLRELCIERGVPPELIFKVPVGADPDRFHPQVDGRIVRDRHDLEGPVVLYLGQLHGAQYLEYLLEAFRQVRGRHPQATLLVVGGGDRFGELHAHGERLGINDSVVFTNAIPHEEVPLYIAAADVAVACFDDNPQTRCKSPLKVVEYLAMGKAIVGTRMGELKKMLAGGAGLLVPPMSNDRLAAAVCEVLESPELRQRLEAAARRQSETEYNWAASAQALASAYDIAAELRAGERRKVYKAELPVAEPAPDAGPPARRLPIWWPHQVRRFVERNLDLAGIVGGERGFTGPSLVQLDVTNNCENDCIACWCNSPMLGDLRMSAEVKQQQLPLDLVERLLDELQALGTREIYMAGGGEPFIHPKILEIVSSIKRRGLVLYLNTSFTLVTPDRAQQLVEMGVDHMTVSVWAGTPETYALVHPNRTEETFSALRECLEYLNRIKEQAPLIKLYNVVSCLNFGEIPEMVRFARDTGCESVEFTVVDTMPEATDSLLLEEAERRQAVELFRQARQEAADDDFEIFNADLFERRLANVDSVAGLPDSDIIHSMPCTIGWTFARVLPDGDVNACLKAHRIPVGNIFERPFTEIWNGHRQRSFRRHTNVLVKDDPFFRQIGNDPEVACGCVKSCDDVGRNMHNFERLQGLGLLKRRVLKRAAVHLTRGADS